MDNQHFWNDTGPALSARDHYESDCQQVSMLFDQLKDVGSQAEANKIIEMVKPYFKEIQHLVKDEEVLNGK